MCKNKCKSKWPEPLCPVRFIFFGTLQGNESLFLDISSLHIDLIDAGLDISSLQIDLIDAGLKIVAQVQQKVEKGKWLFKEICFRNWLSEFLKGLFHNNKKKMSQRASGAKIARCWNPDPWGPILMHPSFCSHRWLYVRAEPSESPLQNDLRPAPTKLS